MSGTETAATTVIGISALVNTSIIIALIKLRERVAKIEEWARLEEKRINGIQT